jgi:hypothetical protein
VRVIAERRSVMTSSELTRSGIDIAPPTLRLPAELIDALAELIARSPDPCGRAAVVASVLQEIYSTVEWLDDLVVSPTELLSLSQVLSEARAHQHRVSTRRPRS